MSDTMLIRIKLSGGANIPVNVEKNSSVSALKTLLAGTEGINIPAADQVSLHKTRYPKAPCAFSRNAWGGSRRSSQKLDMHSYTFVC